MNHPWARCSHFELARLIQAVFAEVARERGLPVRASTEAARSELRAAGARTPDHFLDGFYGGGATAENLRALLRGLGDGTTELMCHPGRADEELLAGSTYARERERELAILCDPELPLLLEREQVERVDFRDL